MYSTVFGLLSTSLFNMLSFYFELMPKIMAKSSIFLQSILYFTKRLSKYLESYKFIVHIFLFFMMTAKEFQILKFSKKNVVTSSVENIRHYGKIAA